MTDASHQQQAGHDIHVVVIDDQPMVVEFVRRALADDQRIKVHGYSDSAVALTELRGPLAGHEVDLVVVDLMMPGDHRIRLHRGDPGPADGADDPDPCPDGQR